MSDMRRREFAALIGGVGLLLAVKVRRARGQQSAKIPRIGIIDDSPIWNAFRHGLRGLGYLEGQNIAFEYRYAGGLPDRLAWVAVELVHRPVDLIATFGTPPTLAAKQATTTIPIVMMGVGDPVGSGLVASLARPGGNVTGVSSLAPELTGKQLEFLKSALPTVSHVALLCNPANPANAFIMQEADVAAQRLGVQLHRVEAHGPEAFASAFAAMTRARADALLVLGDAMFFEHRRRLAELAAMSHLPTMHNIRPDTVGQPPSKF